MEWLGSIEARPRALPAVWLITTDARPATLAERSSLRRGIAREILARYLALDPAALAIDHDPQGRPLLVRPGANGLHLSLATRAGMVAVALAARPVGVDVERVEAASEPPLAMLHPEERRDLAAMPPGLRAAAFGRLWSIKEAYVKALGTGFATAPESFAVSCADEGTIAIRAPGGPGIREIAVSTTKNGGQETLAAAIVVLA